MPAVQMVFNWAVNVFQVAGNGLWDVVKAITLLQ